MGIEPIVEPLHQEHPTRQSSLHCSHQNMSTGKIIERTQGNMVVKSTIRHTIQREEVLSFSASTHQTVPPHKVCNMNTSTSYGLSSPNSPSPGSCIDDNSSNEITCPRWTAIGLANPKSVGRKATAPKTEPFPNAGYRQCHRSPAQHVPALFGPTAQKVPTSQMETSHCTLNETKTHAPVRPTTTSLIAT